jgi:adenylate cyclase
MPGTRRERRKAAAQIAVAALAVGVGVTAYATNLLRPTELQSLDARFSIRGRQHVPSNIVIVKIDEKTLGEFRERDLASEFPFPRSYEARVVQALLRAGARAIAVDIEFGHPTAVPGSGRRGERLAEEETDDLFEALGRARGRTVLAASEVGPRGETEVFGGARHLREIGARAGAVALTTDSDGAVRRLAHSFNHLTNFAVATAEVAARRRYPSSLFEEGTLPIDFVGPPESFKSVSFWKVMLKQVPAATFENKIVFVGAYAPILGDEHHTAVGGSLEMPGVEIWANATSTLLRGVPLRGAPAVIDVLLIALLGIAAPLSSVRLKRWRLMLVSVALAALFAVAVQVAFDDGRIVSFVYPLLALAIGVLGTLGLLYVDEAIERERVRSVFSRFVSGSVVDQVLERTDENLRLGGVERDCTVLFSDLRGFTSFSESQPAALVIEVVNHYLNEMTEAILAAGGTLIAYMGDGIMAVFGTPIEHEDHADRALAAAREMIGPRLARFNTWMAERGFERRFEMGVGLNSGPVMAGNVGSEQRIEYTAIGDTTNTASRLEGMTKDSEAMLFVAASTKQRLKRLPDDLARVGEVSIRGRTQKMEVWTIWPTRNNPKPALGREVVTSATISDRQAPTGGVPEGGE